jgi:hypothetical protein
MIEGHTTVLGAPPNWNQSQGKCVGLPVRIEPYQGQSGLHAFTSAWTADEADIIALVQGASLKLTVIGSSHPPVALAVGMPVVEATERVVYKGEEHVRSMHVAHLFDRLGGPKLLEALDRRGVFAAIESALKEIAVDNPLKGKLA